MLAVPDRKDASKQKKKATPAPKGRTGVVESLTQYFRDVRSEFRKVIWPTRAEINTSTVVVLTTLLFFTVLIGVLDFVFSRIVTLVIG